MVKALHQTGLTIETSYYPTTLTHSTLPACEEVTRRLLF